MMVSLNQTSTSLDQLDLDAVNAANQVNAFMNEVRFMIDEREKDLLKMIEKQREEQEKNLSLEKERLEYHLESMRHCHDYSKALLEHGNPVEITSTSQPVLSRLTSLLSSPILPPQQPNELPLQLMETKEKEMKQDIHAILSSLGQIISLGSSEDQQQKQKEKVTFLLILFHIWVSLNQLFSFSLQALSLGSSFSSFSENFSTVGKVVRTIGSSGEGILQFSHPRGMAIDRKGRIFVADRWNYSIQCFDSQGNFLFKFGIKGNGKREFECPRDVAFDSKNQRILVADTGNHRIQAFDLQRVFLFAFGSKGDQSGNFKQPCGITTNQLGNILVSDTCNHRVQVFDEKGKFLRKFGSEGAGQGQLKYPLGIGILSNGDVVVAESNSGNKRLSVFNPQGRFVRLIGEGKLKNPLWLFVDSQDNILVAENGDGNESLLVFSKEGRFVGQIGHGVFKLVSAVVVNHKGEIFASGRGKDGQNRVFVF